MAARLGLAGVLGLAGALPATASVGFTDVTDLWQVPFRHHHGGQGDYYMIETMGSGVVVVDYDYDGDLDLLFVDSGDVRAEDRSDRRLVLYRNDGIRFVDVSARSGLALMAYGMGGTAGDIDNDGNLDLYITAFGTNQLFRNRGDGAFEDVTASAGVGDELWSASAAFADADRDGDLDLYVANYVDFAYDNNPFCGDQDRNLRAYCHPDVYDGSPDSYFRNRGDGTFEDATSTIRSNRIVGKGLGVLFVDLDDDGWPDIYVANDMTANFLLLNQHDGTFEEMGLVAGVAFGEQGEPEAGMGVDMGDLDGDGRSEVMVTHLDMQTNALYSSMGEALFVDRRFPLGLAEASFFNVGFGVAFADVDQDGDLDVIVANGHIIDNIEAFGTGSTFKQRNQVFVNNGSGVLQEVSDSGLNQVRSSRGLATGDLDLDGDLDLAISNSNDVAEVYRNDATGAGHWLQIDLVGSPSNRFGIGARLDLDDGDGMQRRNVRTASSYLSQSALTAHFGLGAATRVKRLTVQWPSGKLQAFGGLPVDRRLQLFE